MNTLNGVKIKVDYALCKECGICVLECPNHIKKTGHEHADHDYEYCDRCLHCYAVCPHNAIRVEGVDPVSLESNLSADQLLTHFMCRRSYRRFADKPVSEDVLKQLTDAARYIPSGGNDHRLHITVLTSEDKRKELLSAIGSYYNKILKLLNNPLLQIIAKNFGDAKVKATLKDSFYFNKIVRIIKDIRNEDDIVFYHAPAVFIFHTDRIMPTAKEDCILAAYNLSLFSETLGLGSCFVSLSQQAITNDKECKRILSIPKSHRVEAVVAVGYPKRVYKRPSIRSEKTVHVI